jgi:hypothetical protein
MYINPGDGILTERPTYLGALQAWKWSGLSLLAMLSVFVRDVCAQTSGFSVVSFLTMKTPRDKM